MFRWKGGGDNTHWQPRTLGNPHGLSCRGRGGSPSEKEGRTRKEKHIQPDRMSIACADACLLVFVPSFFLVRGSARRITHWCYNPLVLRRRTCCPVSNTLFSFLSLSLSLFSFLFRVCAWCLHHPPIGLLYDARPIGTHMHTLPPWTRGTREEVSSSVPLNCDPRSSTGTQFSLSSRDSRN